MFDRVAKTGAIENAMIGIGTATAAQIDKIFAKIYCPVQSVLMLVMDTYRPIRVSTARGKDEWGTSVSNKQSRWREWSTGYSLYKFHDAVQK